MAHGPQFDKAMLYLTLALFYPRKHLLREYLLLTGLPKSLASNLGTSDQVSNEYAYLSIEAKKRKVVLKNLFAGE